MLPDRSGDDIDWGGKGATLAWLAPRVSRCRVPAGRALTLSCWNLDRRAAIAEIAALLGPRRLAVRSDRVDEDRRGFSRAGHYRSVIGVDGASDAAIEAAVESVFAGYGTPRHDDRVLIQHEVSPILDAAVLSTRAIGDGAPYYALSVAPGPRSDAVTRGDSEVETWYVARDRAPTERLPDRLLGCFRALIELERLLGSIPFEIEIVRGPGDLPWLLQARPLALGAADDVLVAERRRSVSARIAQRPAPRVFGLMPDWNPSELLGEHPRPLARDLFDRLIGRRAFRLGRAELGYAPLPRVRLVHVFGGRPYVDVVASFRSLLPRGLDAALGARLVAAWCARLLAHPELHDAVEFDVASTVLTCGFDEEQERRYPGCLSARERNAFRSALAEPTARALDAGLAHRLAAAVEGSMREVPPAAGGPQIRRWLLRTERSTATAFAAIARQAFALEAIVRSAVAVGALDASRLAAIKRGIATVASELQREWAGPRALDAFGDLRAGTFEMTAPRLAEIASALDRPPRLDHRHDAAPDLDDHSARCLTAALRAVGIGVGAHELIDRYRVAVRAREYGKFALARRISHLLETIAAHAAAFGVDRETASWLPLDALTADAIDAARLRRDADEARERHAQESRLRMPLLMSGPDLSVVAFPPGRPSYIGAGRVAGRLIELDARSVPDALPIRACVAIASADPGFDWIFLRGPVLLVTAFGGPNSHMALRCAELGVPALLGVGPDAFRRILARGSIAVDFDGRAWTLR